VEGLLHSAVTFDGRVLEFFHHGASTARFDVRAVDDVVWELEPNGLTLLRVMGIGSPPDAGPVMVVGFGPEQREAAVQLRMAIEAARAGS
jgi:hypothetical protein